MAIFMLASAVLARADFQVERVLPLEEPPPSCAKELAYSFAYLPIGESVRYYRILDKGQMLGYFSVDPELDDTRLDSLVLFFTELPSPSEASGIIKVIQKATELERPSPTWAAISLGGAAKKSQFRFITDAHEPNIVRLVAAKHGQAPAAHATDIFARLRLIWGEHVALFYRDPGPSQP